MPEASWAAPVAGRRVTDGSIAAGPPVIVVDLGATHLRLALAGAAGLSSIETIRTVDLGRSPEHGVVPGLVEAVRRAAEAHLERPQAVGVGVAAYVARSGVVLQERPFGIPAGAALRDQIAEATGLPTIVDNDANLAALAEVEHGAARGFKDVAVITLGTNVGLGIVADGRVIRGAHGAAGEAGTLLVPANRGRDGRGPYARAGRLGHGRTDAPDHYALLEDLVGGGALGRSVEQAGESTSGAGATQRTAGGPLTGGVFAKAAAGDRRARVAARHAVEGWAMLIADLVALLDPELFVISGGLAEDAAAFIEPLRSRANELCPLPPEIVLGHLGAHAGLVGAAVVARSSLAPDLAGSGAGPDRITQRVVVPAITRPGEPSPDLV